MKLVSQFSSESLSQRCVKHVHNALTFVRLTWIFAVTISVAPTQLAIQDGTLTRFSYPNWWIGFPRCCGSHGVLTCLSRLIRIPLRKEQQELKKARMKGTQPCSGSPGCTFPWAVIIAMHLSPEGGLRAWRVQKQQRIATHNRSAFCQL